MTGAAWRGPGAPPPFADRLHLVPDHVGLVVEDLDAALAGTGPFLGEPAKRVEMGELGLRSAVFRTAGLDLEFLSFSNFARSQAAASLDPRVFASGGGIQHGEVVFFTLPGTDVLWEFVERGVRGEEVEVGKSWSAR